MNSDLTNFGTLEMHTRRSRRSRRSRIRPFGGVIGGKNTLKHGRSGGVRIPGTKFILLNSIPRDDYSADGPHKVEGENNRARSLRGERGFDAAMLN